VNITVRVSAPGPRNINLEIADDANELYQPRRSTAGDMTFLKTLRGKMWSFSPTTHIAFWVYFAAGNTNLCSIIISSQVGARPIPFSINALEYDDSSELGKEIQGNCVDGQPPITEPDAQTTTKDAACQALGPCHIAFVQPQEYVVSPLVTMNWCRVLFHPLFSPYSLSLGLQVCTLQ
jgi:hypothetical protein